MLSEILQRLKYENFYWNIGFYGLVLAGVTHAFFLLLFLYLHIPQLALVNVVSVAIYLYSIFGIGLRALDRKDDSTIGWLVYGELLGHGVIATLYLGLESGFQYYIYSLVLIPFFISTYSPKIRLLRAFGVIATALFLEWWGYSHPPLLALPSSVIHNLHYMNLALFLLIIATISYFYTLSGNDYRDMLFERSNRDYLTGLYNRHYLNERIKNGLVRRGAKHQSFAILLIDVDYFKKINDTYGHSSGDKVLKHLAEVLKEHIGRSAIISRWGGEEFLVLFEACSEDMLVEMAEYLRITIKQTPMLEGKERYITVTIGAAISEPKEPFESVFYRADAALYRGKEEGRDRVVCAKELTL